MWGSAYMVCRPTEKEARDYLHYYVVEKGDRVAANNILTGGLPKRAPDTLDEIAFRLIAGWYGYQLVGTPEQIASEMVELSRAGLDGCVLSWVDYEAGLRNFHEQVLPLLEQAGVREPFVPAAATGASQQGK